MSRQLGWAEQDTHEDCRTKRFLVVVMRSGLLMFVGALVWACSVCLENRALKLLISEQGKKQAQSENYSNCTNIEGRERKMSHFPFGFK